MVGCALVDVQADSCSAHALGNRRLHTAYQHVSFTDYD